MRDIGDTIPQNIANRLAAPNSRCVEQGKKKEGWLYLSDGFDLSLISVMIFIAVKLHANQDCRNQRFCEYVRARISYIQVCILFTRPKLIYEI